MTAHELARQLLAGPDLEVHFSYPAGDHWRTTLAPVVTTCHTSMVIHSEYHRMSRVLDEAESESLEDARTVVVIQ